jgi:excinuclease ABC subunit C
MQNLLEGLPKTPITEKVYLKLPETSGVYVYFKDTEVLYIGKAINLKRRVSSYFDFDLESKTARMMSLASHLSFIQVTSELEALLLEAKLIRQYMPHYNIVSKDDKHPLYIRISKEEFPRVLTARKIEAKEKNIAFYGPFPSSRNVKSVLRIVRRIFPFSDHKLAKRPCLYSHIGLCNPCPNLIAAQPEKEALRKLYLKNIKSVKSILDGNISEVAKELDREMQEYSGQENYEKAAEIRNKLKQIEYITRPQLPTDFYLENPNLYEDTRKKEENQLRSLLAQKNINLKNLHRIECFDIAHLAGTNATASMVTFKSGEPDKNYYRHFKIRIARGGDDYGSLGEVGRRRAKHFEDWGKPDLIIIDGGVGQVKSFSGGFNNIADNSSIPIVGIAKHPDRLIIGTERIRLTGAALNLVSRLRDEAHRFARRYHHKLVSNAIKFPGK